MIGHDFRSTLLLKFREWTVLNTLRALLTFLYGVGTWGKSYVLKLEWIKKWSLVLIFSVVIEPKTNFGKLFYLNLFHILITTLEFHLSPFEHVKLTQRWNGNLFWWFETFEDVIDLLLNGKEMVFGDGFSLKKLLDFAFIFKTVWVFP